MAPATGTIQPLKCWLGKEFPHSPTPQSEELMTSTHRMIHSLSTLVLAVGIAACGGDDVTNTNGNGTTTVASVAVTPASPTLTSIGATVQLTASALDAGGNPISGKTFTWASADDNTATVSSSGLVTAVANGSVNVTATTDGRNGTATISVNDSPLTSVIVGDNFFNASSLTVANGATVTWNWSGANPHSVIFDDGLGNSAVQASGTHTREFNTAGTFGYFCSVHGASIMSGEIVVP